MLNSNLFIYGTGSMSESLVRELSKKKIEFNGFIDSNENKIGNVIQGKEIFSLKYIVSEIETFFIIVASSYYSEIVSRLEHYHLKEYKDFCSADFFIPHHHSNLSYSQYGEDILIDSILNKIKFKENGRYIDVGAYHPFKFSNTYKFYLKGWNGINIEPTPYKTELFEFSRGRDINLNVGISLEEIDKDLYIYEENAYNTTELNRVEELKNKKNLMYKEVLNLSFKPLRKIIRKYSYEEIQLLNIDVEGQEIEVLNSIDWKSTKIWIIAIEIFDAENSEVRLFLENKGYIMVAKSLATGIFVLKEFFGN